MNAVEQSNTDVELSSGITTVQIRSRVVYSCNGPSRGERTKAWKGSDRDDRLRKCDRRQQKRRARMPATRSGTASRWQKRTLLPQSPPSQTPVTIQLGRCVDFGRPFPLLLARRSDSFSLSDCTRTR